MKKFVCPVCGYVYEGEFIPEGFKCPVCGVDGSKFKVMEEGKLAAEHEYGIYAKTVKNNPDISEEDKKYIFEQLMANFQGECSEVGISTAYGSPGEEMRLFLTEDGYQAALQSQQRREIKIKRYARVIEGHILDFKPGKRRRS